MRESRSAASPATCGAAIEVPRATLYESTPSNVDQMPSPGAKRSTAGAPRFEKPGTSSPASEAPTQTMFAVSYAQGYSAVVRSSPASTLPAATTNSVSGCAAMTSFSAWENRPLEKLALTTRTLWSPAKSKARTMSETLPPILPSDILSSTRRGRIRASGATPAEPLPLSSAAAMIPATSVPWPSRSCGSVSPSIRSYPGTRLSIRSSCSASTPESTTATSWPAPVLWSQAWRTSMSLSSVPVIVPLGVSPGVGMVCAVLSSAQSRPKRGSFGGGAAAASRMRSGSA